MDTISLVFIFTLGVIIGSFVNVVGLRYNTGLSAKRGRSKCFTCNKYLSWNELVPVASFFIQKGRCKHCNTKISWQYPLVELLTGITFVLIALRQFGLWKIYGGFSYGFAYSVFFFVYYAFAFSLLYVILIYDVKHKIIPDKLVYTFILLGIVKMCLFFFSKRYVDPGMTIENMFDIASPVLLSFPLALLWVISSGRWIGFGDVKLAFGIGALLGFVSGASALVLSFWIGAIYGVIVILRGRFSIDHRKKYTMSSEVPFAPFMIIATLIVFFAKLDLLSLGDFLSLLN